MHVKQTVYKLQLSRGMWRHAPPPQKIVENSRPEIDSGGFGQLADYPTLVLKITAN